MVAPAATFEKMAMIIEKVLISDSIDASCRQFLETSGISVDYKAGLSKPELLAIVKDYDGLIVRSGTKVTAEVIKAGHKLKLIGRAGTGVDNIDLDAATAQGVIVMNTPGGNTISAAEHTCAMMCAVARNIPQGYYSMREGLWDRKKYMGVELLGKTLGIVGLGKIGREVATRMQSFGMKTVGYDPLVPAEVATQFGVEFMELEQIWPIADFVTVHVPLIPATKGMINDAVFAKCKQGVRFVNVARGGIIDEDALLRALESGQCGGAALDVFAQEPPTNRALLDHGRLVCTPHLGASTVEAQLKVAQEIAQQFVDAVQGKGLMGVVNVPNLSNAMLPSSVPWVHLGTRLGRLGSALLHSQPKALTVTVRGDGIPRGFWLSTVLVGCLGEEGGVNLVNAEGVAKGRGVSGMCCHEDGGEGGVTVQCEVEGGGVEVRGTVAGDVPVLTAIGGEEVGLFELRGKVVVCEGMKLVEAVQQLPDAMQVYQAGRFILLRVEALPTTPPPGCRAAVALD